MRGSPADGGRVLDLDLREAEAIRARAEAFGAFSGIPLDVIDGEGALRIRWGHLEGEPPGRPADLAEAARWGAELCRLVERVPRDLPLWDLRPDRLLRTPAGWVLFDPGWLPEGTPGYASPEQHGRGEVGWPAGLYQLGACLVEWLAGAPPPDALTLLLPGVEPPALPGLPAGLQGRILALLEPDPADRPDPGEVAQALEGWLASQPQAPEPGADPEVASTSGRPLLLEAARGPAPAAPPRRALGWAGVALAGLGLAALGLDGIWAGSVSGPGPGAPAGDGAPPAPVRAGARPGARPSGRLLPRSWISPGDGAPMILIPAGPFRRGPYAEDPPGSGSTRVELPAFYLDRFEVTNRRFLAFVRASGYQPQGQWRRYDRPGREDHPVIAVSYYDAQAYAEWAGKRLPTEDEWEKAARGGDGRRHPWGSRWRPEAVHSMESALGGTAPVGSHPQGASPFGVEDMAGSVWEWVDGWYLPLGSLETDLPLLRVGRGGSRNDPRGGCTTTARRGVFPENGNLVGAGFRCALDPAP